MTKYLLAVVLFYLCHRCTTTKDLNNEIIKRLRDLNGLYANKTVQLPNMFNNPSAKMSKRENVQACVGVFVRELNILLNNVTVDEDHKHLVQEIKENLNLMRSSQEGDARNPNCHVVMKSISIGNRQPFNRYIKFLTEVNIQMS